MTDILNRAKAHPFMASLCGATGVAVVSLVTWGFIAWNGSVVYAGELAVEMRPVTAAITTQTESTERLTMILAQQGAETRIYRLRTDRRDHPDEWTDDKERALIRAEERLEKIESALFQTITP